MAYENVVVPNAVGVDIGCGMCAVKTNWRVEDIPVKVLREQIMPGISTRIPVGALHHEEAQSEEFMPHGHDIEKMTVVKQQYEAAHYQVGTLGGGNHFIELQRDEYGMLWIMIHSGSRNLGKKVGDYYNKVAAELNARWFSMVTPRCRCLSCPWKRRSIRLTGMKCSTVSNLHCAIAA